MWCIGHILQGWHIDAGASININAGASININFPVVWKVNLGPELVNKIYIEIR